jgi:hypothetical protein
MGLSVATRDRLCGIRGIRHRPGRPQAVFEVRAAARRPPPLQGHGGDSRHQRDRRLCPVGAVIGGRAESLRARLGGSWQLAGPRRASQASGWFLCSSEPAEARPGRLASAGPGASSHPRARWSRRARGCDARVRPAGFQRPGRKFAAQPCPWTLCRPSGSFFFFTQVDLVKPTGLDGQCAAAPYGLCPPLLRLGARSPNGPVALDSNRLRGAELGHTSSRGGFND